MPTRPFTRLLVANRGEIARRVLRAARVRGLDTVAVFADDDRHAPFVAEADQAVALGPGPLSTTYLSVAAVVEAARRTGADAVHPGYGFLSEDPALAEACHEAGLVWVGPPAKAMATMANKAVAKATVAAAGVPVLAGAVIDTDDPAALAALGARVGFPVLVKASAGGGGRGMRAVERAEDLSEAVAAARREALGAFGSDEVFLERLLRAPRHIEVQVVADSHGNVLYLFDRECSIQRRHQKVVEEAPAIFVPEHLRDVMQRAAVDAARAVAYEGVGTVEFVVAGDECAFLEMNTRLQVEHGVTELVTGLDLVDLQLAIAGGAVLPLSQADVTTAGHSIEVRLCAERPRENYQPTPGMVTHARWPTGPGVRVDAAVETGSVVSPHYDSLVAKIMSVGPDREVATALLERALCSELELDGLETNREMLAAVLAHPDFRSGSTSTDFLERHSEIPPARLEPNTRARHAVAASVFLEAIRARTGLVPGVPPSWRNMGRAAHRDEWSDGVDHYEVVLRRGRDGLEVTVTGTVETAGVVEASVTLDSATTGSVALQSDGLLVTCRVRCHGHEVGVNSAEGQSSFHLAVPGVDDVLSAVAGECRAPLPGSVAKILVGMGEIVDEGTGLVVLEAMKMEHTLRATGRGTVQAIRVDPGSQVEVGQLLVVIEPMA